MGEKEKNGKTWREKRAESFALKFLLVNFFTKLGFWDFVVKAPLQNYKNSLINILTIGAKKEENQKRPKSKNKTGSRKSTGQEE